MSTSSEFTRIRTTLVDDELVVTLTLLGRVCRIVAAKLALQVNDSTLLLNRRGLQQWPFSAAFEHCERDATDGYDDADNVSLVLDMLDDIALLRSHLYRHHVH